MNIKTLLGTPQRKPKANLDLSTSSCQDKMSNVTALSKENSKTGNNIKQFDLCYALRSKNQRLIAFEHRIQQKLRKKRNLKQVLGKMVLIKYANIKNVFTMISNLPQRQSSIIRTNPTKIEQIAQRLVMKTPITMQTAILRSLIYLRQHKQKNKIQQQQKNQNQLTQHLKITPVNQSVTIYPYEQFTIRNLQKIAIIFLNQLSKQKIKKVIKCFVKQNQNNKHIRNYFFRVIKNFDQNKKYFIRKLRIMSKLQREKIVNMQRKSLEALLNRCIQRRDKIIIESLKQSHRKIETKKMLFFEHLRKYQRFELLSAFFKLYRNYRFKKQQDLKPLDHINKRIRQIF